MVGVLGYNGGNLMYGVKYRIDKKNELLLNENLWLKNN